MTLPVTPTTLLQAVNELLTAVGTTPVNTLNVSGLTDAAIAQDVIGGVSREVQSRGWWFNTVRSMSLAPSGGNITVPANMLSCRPALANSASPGESAHFVMREGKLYDLLNNTYAFTQSVRVDAVMLFDFESLPESLRRYITVRSARVFQTKVLGDETLGVFTEEYEQEAWQTIMDDHVGSGPSTIYLDRSRLRFRETKSAPVTSLAQNRQQRRQ